MKGDFSRSTFRPARHYRSVRVQQGRVQTDADWNEQSDLVSRRTEVGSADVIGLCGAPLENPGFGLLAGAVPRLTAGHFYADGILCENDAEIPLNQQPDQPGFSLPTADGFYLAYLDVFEQHVTALEDPLVREVALGGPDTTTRERTVWQVKLLTLAGAQHCSTPLDAWDDLVDRPRGGLRARTNPGSISSDPCIISPGGGFRRLENQLYRVEIHTPGPRGTARFKWSRDNGSIVTAWLDQQGSDLTVRSTGRDQVLGFAPGQTVEVVDDAREHAGQAGILVRISGAEGQVLKLDSTDPAAATVDKADFPDLNTLGAPNHPKVRRWDSDGEIATGAGWIPLEDGVEVSFETGDYQAGDYWLIPARTATDDVEWPREADGDPIPQEPHGVLHHYCRLAVLQRSAGNFTVVEDCRPLFPSLSSLVQFSILGGDGQESLPNQPLAQPLRAGISLGPYPVGVGPLAGMHLQVEFSTTPGGHLGSVLAGLSGEDNVLRIPVTNGQALCFWQLDAGDLSRAQMEARRSQTVTATLLDSVGNNLGLLPLTFNAGLSLSSRVDFRPQDDCTSLAGVTTVEEALDRLCLIEQVSGRCCLSVGEGGEFVTIEQAILTLLERGERNICLCLLPSEHTSGPLEVHPPADAAVHLEINGSAGSLVILKDPWVLDGLASLTLDSIFFQAGDIGDRNPFITISNCGEVSIRNCHFTAVERGGYLMGIEAISRLQLINNWIEVYQAERPDRPTFPGTVLGDLFNVADRASFSVLSNNLVRGNLANLRIADRRTMSTSFRALADPASDMELTSAGRVNLLLAADALETRRVDENTLFDALLELRDTFRPPGRALFLTVTQAEITLQDNHIYGLLAFYGPSSQTLPGRDFFAQISDPIRARLKAGSLQIVSRGGTLLLRGNRLTQIFASEEMVNLLQALAQGQGNLAGIFTEAVLNENFIAMGNNLLIAENIQLQGNIFRAAAEPFQGVCLSEVGIYVGNRGNHPDAHLIAVHQLFTEVANLRLAFL